MFRVVAAVQNTRVLIKLYHATVSWFVTIVRTVLNVNLRVTVDLTSQSSQQTNTTASMRTVCGRQQIAGPYETAHVRSFPNNLV